MNTDLQNGYFLPSILIICLFLFSCNKVSKSEAETSIGDYKIPETIPLEFTDPIPFEWEAITNDTLLTPVTYSLDVDALPGKPFDLNQFRPLKAPMEIEDLDWDKLPTKDFESDSIPFTVTKSTIREPIVAKLSIPAVSKDANANLLQLSVAEGLVHNKVTSFLENDNGTVWVGSSLPTFTATEGCLTLYDGETSTTYAYPTINAMSYDKEGRLWLAASRYGIYVLDFQNNVEYKITPSDFDFFGADVICDHNGLIYIAAWRSGFFTIDPALQNLQKIANTDDRSTKLLEDSEHNIWLGAKDSLAVLDQERKFIKTIPIKGIHHRDTGAFDIHEDKEGTIWVCFNSFYKAINTDHSKVARISRENKTITTLSSDNGYDISGHCIQEDQYGNHWMAGLNEIFILSSDLATYKKIRTSTIATPASERIGSLQRKDGTLWFGTIGRGIAIANHFTAQTAYFDSSSGLINDEVWDIEEDSRGEIWLGTAAGINIIDPQEKTIKAITHQQLHNSSDFSIGFIKEISPDKFMFRSAARGFAIYDRQKKNLTQHLSESSSPIEIWGIEILDSQTLFIYAVSGLYKYNFTAEKLEKLVTQTDEKILNNTTQVNLSYDAEQTIWLATSNEKGIAQVDLENRTIRFLTEEKGLSDKNSTVVRQTQEGEIWVTTLRGISILNPEQNTLTNLKAENGLIPDEIYDLVERDSIMYVASVDGLMPVNKATAKTSQKGYVNFNGGYGFSGNDYLVESPTFLENGQFWSGVVSPDGKFKLLTLDSAPKPDHVRSSVHINNIYVMDEQVGLDTLVLPYDQNSVSFRYSSDDVYNRNKLNYRYILEGEDEDWTFTTSKTNSKNYYNLRPGPYAFKVSSRSVNQEWSQADTFKFYISPPWWQTWWAYLIFAITGAVILRGYVLFRARKLTRENKLLEHKVNLRTNELKTSLADLQATQSQLIQSEKMASLGELTAGIAHEIQNPLNFVNNFSEVSNELIDEMNEELDKGDLEEAKFLSADIKQNLEKINHHGKRADAIVKGMLQHSRKSTAKKEPTDINKLADEYLRLAYHGLRAKDKSFNATIKTEFDESIGMVHIIPQDIGRVILNLITNAFYAVNEKSSIARSTTDEIYKPTVTVVTKHADSTGVERGQNGSIEISVIDNGNGIPKQVLDKIFQPFFTTKPTGEGTGLGLSLSYDIVTAHGGQLKAYSVEGEETTFTMILPN